MRAWRSLSARLALWYVVVTLASFAAATLVFAVRARASVEREGARSAAGALERYRQALETGGTEALRSMFDCAPEPRPALRVTDERDEELFSISADELSRRAVTNLDAGAGLEGGGSFQVARAEVSQQRHLSIALHDAQSDALWTELRETSLAIFCVGFGLSVLGAMLITRRFLQPVTELALATQKILESGDLRLRVQTGAATNELTQLTELFNRMLAKNEALVKAMRESLDNVAHDLRTPLTRLRAGAEIALQSPPDHERERDALGEVIEESELVLSMLTTLTDIVEAEAGAMRLDKQREDLSQIMRQAVDLYDVVAKDKGLAVVTHLEPEVSIHADRRRVFQVCANLLDNAVKYTPAGGRVEISVLRAEKQAVCRVADTGIGIAPDDRARVWERLFRADRSRGERGLGLGLSLVKAVVEAHGGEVRLESELGQGATFEIRLPLVPTLETHVPARE
jgi:signal transduction histidine kinase